MVKKAILCLFAAAVCVLASAQEIKPVKDRQTKKYGYQDKQKNWVIPPSYDDAKRFDDDGCALVKLGGRYGLIDGAGKWIIPADYDDIGKFNKDGLCELKIKEGKVKLHGVADRSGAIVLPVQYNNVDLPRKGGCILASSDVDKPGLQGSSLWGVYDTNGNEIFAPQFLYSPSVYEGGILMAKEARSGLYGIVDTAGNICLPFSFLEISRYGSSYRTLDKNFTQATFTADFRRAEYFPQPGAVKPYDPMDDPVRAAAWHSGCIGRRLYANQVRVVEIQSGFLGPQSALCRELAIDWGRGRFIRLEPFVTESADEFAMSDPVGGQLYTLKALLYEADGSFVRVVSDCGFVEAECKEGFIYTANGGERWLLHMDPNSLAIPSYTLALNSYRALVHDNVCNALGISLYDLQRLWNVYNFSNRNVEIIEKENIGVTSYLPPVIDMRDARKEYDVMRHQVFHHAFMMGEVVNCSVHHVGEDVEVKLHDNLILGFEDRFRDPSYTLRGEQIIWWGPHNARTVRISLRATHSKDALADDVSGTGLSWFIVLSMYEEDGTWLRTLAEVPFADYAQDGVIVFEHLGVALLSPGAVMDRMDGRRFIRLKHAHHAPHTVSALNGFRLHPRPAPGR